MGQSRQDCYSPTEVGPMGLYYSSFNQQLTAVFVVVSWLKQLDQQLLRHAYATSISTKAMNGLLSGD